MVYYKVNINNNITKEIYNKFKRMILINRELYTTKELQNIKNQNYYNYNDKDFIKIECNKNKTAFLFGKRIELK